MPKAKQSKAKPKKTKTKKIKVKSNVPDTSRAKKACPMPMTVNYIDVEGGVKKDKEVKEKDVFDFSYKK
jgi:hypothetical protein